MRPRFSLKTFLIAVALTGAAFGGVAAWRQSIVDQANRHAKAMQALDLRTANPVIRGKDKYPAYVNFVRTWIHPRAFEVRDRICAPRDYWITEHVQMLKDLNGLENVTCFFDELTQSDAESLAEIAELHELSLCFKESQSGALATIASIPTLESLSVRRDVSEELFKSLRGHRNLRKLTLSQTPLTKQNARDLATIPNLISIHAPVHATDSAIFRELANTKLESLLCGLDHCEVSSLGALKQSHVKVLVLFCRQFDAGTLEAASYIPALERLELYGNVEIGPGEFETLKSCKELKELHLPYTWITAEQWDVLSSLPKLQKVRAREHENAKDAIGRFRDSKPGRGFESP